MRKLIPLVFLSCLLSAVLGCDEGGTAENGVAGSLEDSSGSEGTEDGAAVASSGDCSVPPAVTGTLANAVASIDYSDADVSVVVKHKLDIDPEEDRCIAQFEAKLSVLGQGCELQLEFGAEPDSSLALLQASLIADSFCAGWSDADEGVYSYQKTNAVEPSDARVVLPTKVPDFVAEQSCFAADIAFEGSVKLVRNDGASLTVAFSSLQIKGSFLSVGDTSLSCPFPDSKDISVAEDQDVAESGTGKDISVVEDQDVAESGTGSEGEGEEEQIVEVINGVPAPESACPIPEPWGYKVGDNLKNMAFQNCDGDFVSLYDIACGASVSWIYFTYGW